MAALGTSQACRKLTVCFVFIYISYKPINENSIKYMTCLETTIKSLI